MSSRPTNLVNLTVSLVSGHSTSSAVKFLKPLSIIKPNSSIFDRHRDLHYLLTSRAFDFFPREFGFDLKLQTAMAAFEREHDESPPARLVQELEF